MTLLVLTQAVDCDDPVLGFFHEWLVALAGEFEVLEVVCLYEGRHALPKNVHVHSLGKEHGRSRLKYVWRFYRFLFTLHYDAVFVHMNQEYVLLGGAFWKLMGKRVYLWRNFHSGNLGTSLAARLCTGTFSTSESSYLTRFAKNVLMPVGVDMEQFTPDESVKRMPGSILSLGRVAPVKRIEVLVEALGLLAKKGVVFSADIYGDPLPKDADYLESLKARVEALGLASRVTFCAGVPNAKTPPIYRAHDLFVNLSPSGLYDKTIFEAAACGALSVTSSADFAQGADTRLCFPEGDAAALAERLEALLALPAEEKDALRKNTRAFAMRAHSLAALIRKLSEAIH